jgi:hypothetical protein
LYLFCFSFKNYSIFILLFNLKIYLRKISNKVIENDVPNRSQQVYQRTQKQVIIFKYLIENASLMNSDKKNIELRELASSSQTALASVKLIKKLIGDSRWSTASDLLKILKEQEKFLFERIPTETVVRNIWRRVIKIIKDESK